MRTLVITLAALALAGCQTTRYVTRDCLTREQFEELKRQEPEKISGKLTGRADEDIRAVGGSALRLRAWGRNLLDVLEVCSTK